LGEIGLAVGRRPQDNLCFETFFVIVANLKHYRLRVARCTGRVGVVATILSFIRPDDHYFDPEATRLIGEAFDAACKSLLLLTPAAREGVADRIIDAARSGERNPARLVEAGLGPWRKPAGV
jgi:hypothetical protein